MRLHIMLCMAWMPLAVFANTITEKDRQFFIETYADIAISEMKRSNVPASITLAQAILESRWGQGAVAVEANNFFCIKCYNGWEGETFEAKDDEPGLSCFRKYVNVEESFLDHSDFLRNNVRYGVLFEFDPTDYQSWAKGLGDCGYATDPAYGEKLIGLIETYGLWMYDHAMPLTHFDVLKTPVMQDAEEEDFQEVAEPGATSWPVQDHIADNTAIPAPVYEIDRHLTASALPGDKQSAGYANNFGTAHVRKKKIRPIMPVLSFRPERW